MSYKGFKLASRIRVEERVRSMYGLRPCLVNIAENFDKMVDEVGRIKDRIRLNDFGISSELSRKNEVRVIEVVVKNTSTLRLRVHSEYTTVFHLLL